MNQIEKQIKPCPVCGETAGWWSSIIPRLSMVFRDADGDLVERRIVESKQKYCAKCDANVTKCVSAQ